MTAFVDIPTGKTPAAAFDIQQVIDALKGTAGKGIPISPTAVADAISYALSVKNIDTANSRAGIFYGADGNPLLSIDKNGVQASGYGLNALAPVVTTSQAQTLSNKTFTSLVKITTGGLEVDAGNVGIGAAPLSNHGLLIQAALNASGTADGAFIAPTLTAQANSDTLYGLHVGGTFAPNAKTGVTATGLLVDPITGANANNYGVYINTPSGATNNIGLVNLGTSSLVGGVVLGNNAATPPASGLVIYGAPVAAPPSAISLGYQQATTVGAAGAAAALPTNPVAYLSIGVNGSLFKLPLYNP